MLTKIKVIQVGDIHLPTAARERRNVDQKDQTFSVELRNIISAVPTKVVFKQLYRLLEVHDIDALLFMGDFTDVGSVENYERSSAFLANALQIGRGRTHKNLPVGIVPGNHDINRDLAKQPGLGTKFEPLNDCLSNHGLPTLPVERTLTMPIRRDAALLDVNLMNSCWGCGASEYIPAEFREGIGRAIETAIQDGGPGPLRAYYDRQFDTPAFSNESIEDLIRRARELEPNALLLVAAHHNLLPQRLTRLAPYTELVNSGALRSSILDTHRPVVYLHGHIHEDPIEILMTPGGERLVCISAPAAAAGFNVIDFLFTRTGLPLACHVVPWRFDGSGILHAGKRLSVSLIGRRRRSHSNSLSQVYSHLLSVGEIYWPDLVRHSPPFFSDDNEVNLQECVELLTADDSVTVENYDSSPDSWIIRANV